MTDITSHSKIERFQGFPGLNSVVNPYLSLCRHARIFNSHTHIGFMTDITSHSKIERFQGFPGLNSVVNPYLSLCRHALSWASKVHSITGQVILDLFFLFFFMVQL
jgi:ribonuclease BN (tRNA processing enzyme)